MKTLIEHLLSECKLMAAFQFKLCHDSVAKVIYWYLCSVHSLPHAVNWWNHIPPEIVERNSVKLLWNFDIFTDNRISARRPDILWIDKQNLCI